MKRIFIYLKGTPNFGLWYKKNDGFSLKAYTDVDWGKCVDNKRRIIGGAFLFRDRLVSWLSKK